MITAPALWSLKRTEESDAALARLKESAADTAAYQIAEVHAYRGEKDEAFQWLERARQQRDPGLQGTRSDPFFVNLHKDARWPAFLHVMGMSESRSPGG